MDFKLNFVIIGAQKAGTTTLHEVLRKHPEIEMPEGKEHPVLNQPGMTRDRAIESLSALFSKAGRLRGKATPQYLASEQAAQLLHAVNPDVKVIVIVRDPVERSFSHYRMIMRRRATPLDFKADVDRWLSDEGMNAARTTTCQGPLDELPYCVAWSEYARMLEPYLEKFGREQILFVQNDQLKSNPQEVFREIFEFLEVDVNWQSPDFGKVFHKGGDQPIIDLKKLKRIPVLGRTLSLLFPYVPSRMKMLINTRNIRSETKSARELYKDEALRLDAHFADDQARLAQMMQLR